MKHLDAVQKQFDKSRDKAEQFAAATKDVGKAAESAGKGAAKASIGMGKFVSSIARIAKYRAIRALIRTITSAFSEGLANVREYSEGLEGEGHRIAEAFNNISGSGLVLKNQIGSAFAEVLSQLMPIIESIINLLNRAADAISQFFAAFGGNSNYYKAIRVTEDMAKATASGAKSAKEWRNQLMGFDVINRLDAPSEPSGGGGGGLADGANKMFEYTAISDNIRKIAETIKQNLPAIETALGGSLLAVGALLTFSGANIPLGLGLMAIGAYTLGKAVAENWNSVDPKVAAAVGGVSAIVGTALLAVGAVLAFSGANIPLGIGLMVAGLASFSASYVAWGKLNADLRTQIADIGLIVGASLMVLGFIFLLMGMIPLGIGLMLAGGVSIGISQAIGEGTLLSQLKELWKSITNWYNSTIAPVLTWEHWENICRAVFDPLVSFIYGIFQPVLELLNFIFGPHSAQFDVNLNVGYGYDQNNMFPVYAGGGFPEDGFFFANHNELVGQFSNGQTAVANNQEIIAGIERGVYNAVSSAMSGNRAGNEVKVYLDGKQITNAVTRNQRSIERSTGVALA